MRVSFYNEVGTTKTWRYIHVHLEQEGGEGPLLDTALFNPPKIITWE